MNLSGVLDQFSGNAATLMFGASMYYVEQGHVDVRHLDADAVAIGLTSLLAQVESQHPGIAEKYGWCKVSDAAALSSALSSAMLAKPPDGLR